MRRQPDVDLLPEALHSRANARERTGRDVAYALLAAVVVLVTAGHARVLASRARDDFSLVSKQADQLARNERQASAIQAELERLSGVLQRYRQVELPVQVSDVIATVVDAMPESASLDRIEIDADALSRSGSRGRSPGQVRPSRALTAEVSGFARSDLDVADFVGTLDQRPPFDEVSLDFSRQKLVYETPAREFRVSFLIDFTRTYTVLPDHTVVAAEESSQ